MDQFSLQSGNVRCAIRLRKLSRGKGSTDRWLLGAELRVECWALSMECLLPLP